MSVDNSSSAQGEGNVGGHAAQAMSSLPAGGRVGEYLLEAPLWRLRLADAYRGRGPKGPVTIYLIHAAAASVPQVRDALAATVTALVRAPEHKHIARTLDGGSSNGTLYVVTEELDGTNVRDVLLRKRESGGGGFGARGAGNLLGAVASALADTGLLHGALTAESVVVSRTGGIRIADLPLGPATLAAMSANVLTQSSNIAPESLHSGTPSTVADVFGLGSLLYEALVGRVLERGGPRPSEVCPDVNGQIDELVMRACHRNPEQRFGSTVVFRDVVVDALAAAPEAAPAAVPASSSSAIAVGSVAPRLAAAITPALTKAMEVPTERWLLAKGKLDYGPFPLSEIIKQIQSGGIVAGDIVIDKDTGARVDCGKHPLLAPMLDAARQTREDNRRAQAEVSHQSSEKRRGVMLFGGLALGIAAVGVTAWIIVRAVGKDENKQVASISSVGAAQLNVTISAPKVPPKVARGSGGSGGGHHAGAGGGGGEGDGALALDMSGDDDGGSETLGMDTVYGVYSKYGGQLGGCLQSQGGGTANISVIIKGDTGRVTFVKVNDSTTSGLANCIGHVMKSMKFPSVNGPRTRAEFSISL